MTNKGQRVLCITMCMMRNTVERLNSLFGSPAWCDLAPDRHTHTHTAPLLPQAVSAAHSAPGVHPIPIPEPFQHKCCMELDLKGGQGRGPGPTWNDAHEFDVTTTYPPCPSPPAQRILQRSILRRGAYWSVARVQYVVRVPRTLQPSSHDASMLSRIMLWRRTMRSRESQRA